MAACGPSNAQQQLKGYVQRDASLQREFTEAQPVATNRFRTAPQSQSAADFAAFISGKPSFDFNPTEFNQPPQLAPFGATPSAAAASVGSPAQIPYSGRNHQHQQPNWANEFHQFQSSDPSFAPACSTNCTIPHQHVAPCPSTCTQPHKHRVQQHQHQHQHTSGYSQGYQPQFPMFRSQLGQMPMQPSPAQSDESAFAAAFAEAEASLARLQMNAAQTEDAKAEEVPVADDGKDASKVAGQIMTTVGDKVTPDLADKMKSSQFMNLMNKLKTSEVKLDADETEFRANGEKVDAYDLQPDSTHDWPPQRPMEDTLEQPNHVRAEPSRPTLNQDNSAVPLDDYETYQRKLRENLDPRVFQKSLYTSAFKEAVNLKQIPLKTSDWEENYDEWV